MTRLRLAAGAAIAVHAMVARAATACPVCVSDTGVQIRAMLTVDPVWHFAATIAPIPVLLVVVAGVRIATPWILRERGDRDVVARREPI